MQEAQMRWISPLQYLGAQVGFHDPVLYII
jgi:hypothetical protein